MAKPPLGCDLSHHNPTVDFGTLKRGGVEFVALKATEGATRVDPKFVDRRERVRLVGFHRVLFYHYVRPTVDAKTQALHFAKTVGQLAPNERVVLDVEGDGWDHPQNAVDFVTEIVFHLKGALGLKATDVMLYTSLGWARGVLKEELARLAFMPLWVARYNDRLGDVSPWKEATVWQYTQTGRTPGAVGPVDLNRWLDEEAWA